MCLSVDLEYDELNLARLYSRLRAKLVYYQHILDDYQRYGAWAVLLEKFSELCVGFVHDVGNGLNAIQAYLERLALGFVDTENIHLVKNAQAYCQFCGWRLRALTQISPSPVVMSRPVDLTVWFERFLRKLTPCFPSDVLVHLDTLTPHLIATDYDNMLPVAFSEILLNAFQATKGIKDGKVSVLLQKLTEQTIQITIADNGPGLPVADPEKCFDLDFTMRSHSYGVGLAVARRIIEKHSGSFTLRSELGTGVQAIIRLPSDAVRVADQNDDRSLVLTLEALNDEVVVYQQKVEDMRAKYAITVEQKNKQLAALFGQLSESIVIFIAAGLDQIRYALMQLSKHAGATVRSDIHSVLDKCDYCDFVLGNARALNPMFEPQFAKVDINVVLNRAIHLIAWRAQRGTQMKVALASLLPGVEVDEYLLTTVILNLLRNAFDAAGNDGCVELETLHKNGAVLFRVINDGTAIQSDMLPRVFDLDCTTRAHREFGLGLHVSKIVLGDRIKIQSSLDGKTTVSLSFPCEL